MSDPANTILVEHTPAVDPRPFLARLMGRDTPIPEDDEVVTWEIDNKYYTAQISLRAQELGGLNSSQSIHAEGVDVVLYLFETAPSFIAPSLVKLLDTPRDIALAVRTSPTSQGSDEHEEVSEEVQEMLQEVGLEFVDESATPELDDERPISPLEDIRQTLMTHIWPNMVRKELHSRINPSLPPDTPYDGSEDEDEDGIPEAGPSFPTSFDPSQPPPETREKETFPDLQELKAQLEMDDFERVEQRGLDRLDLLDGAFDGGEEYARLEEWLEDDDEEEDDEFGGFVPLEEGSHTAEQQGAVSVEDDTAEQPKYDHPNPDHADGLRDTLGDERDGFDDDFDDFAAFQTAPDPAPHREPTLALDPTPLLLHLQNVRAELASMDEDERRVKAGREVARVMRDLGFGDDIGLDDLDDFDDMAGLGPDDEARTQK